LLSASVGPLGGPLTAGPRSVHFAIPAINMTRRRAISPKGNWATELEDSARLFVERGLAGEAEGLAELYELDAVQRFPPGRPKVGRTATRAF
jgi:hypothetical protein